MKYFKNDYIYDIEVFPNFFCIGIMSVDDSVHFILELSDRKNNLELLIDIIDKMKAQNARMVGFNNLAYDYLILHFILKNLKKLTPLKIYEESQKIFQSMKDERFGKTIQSRFHQVYQLDLFKINHYDNVAKSTSLKSLSVGMGSENVQESPIPFCKILTHDEMDQIIGYNINDLLVTKKFYHENYDALLLRKELSEEYNSDFMNFSDSKIGSEIFVKEIERVKPNSCYRLKNGRREICQTKRSFIKISDCILPYVKFKRPEFKALLDWFKSQTITETKGVFSGIKEHSLKDVAKYARMVEKKSKKLDNEPSEEEILIYQAENPSAEVEIKELKSGKKSYFFKWKEAEALNVVINNHQYVFGVGGIHSSIESQIVHSDDEFMIVDWDVNSYYPNLAIANTIYPEHLGVEFCKVYKDLYERRKTYPKGSPRNTSIKLALNSVYGNSNNQYSPFYDPKYTMTITINGQLSLLMLIESILEQCKDASSIQSNTDGITMKIRRSDSDLADKLVKEWESITRLEMERNNYRSMYIANVNNYIAVFENGKIKRKGAFEYNVAYHQNNSMLVVQKAVEAFLVQGTPIEEFIKNHDNKLDFMMRTKVPKSSKLVLVGSEGNETLQQNISRFYASKGEGCGQLIKVMPPVKDKSEDRRIGICVGNTVKICNNLTDFKWDIDYDFYVKEALKLCELKEVSENEE